tara:strand:+ start:206 stop:466 length:261 start_codon:yes stop_codon:yes gene_type:complete
MLKNTITLLIFLSVVIFFYFVFIQYFSEENIKKINLNRSGIDKNLVDSSSNLPFLENDTNNVIEFNSGFNIENKTERKFWNLFKKK